MTNNAALYGENKGAAQIIDTTSAGQQQFGQLLARQQAQRQLELKQLTDQQAQLKPDGLRNDADRQDFFNQVNDWRNKSISAINERDPYKKSLAQSQAQQAYMQAQSTVAQSKKAAEQESQFSNQLLNPTVRDRYAPDVVNSFLKNKQLGINNAGYVKDPNQWEQVADHEATLKQLDAIEKNRLNQTPFGTPVLSNQKVGNRNATFITNSRTVDPNVMASDIFAHAKVDQNLRKTFQDLYPQIYADQSQTSDQHLQNAIQQYQKDRGPVAEFKAPVEKVDRAPQFPVRFSALEEYNMAHYGNPNAPSTALSNSPTYAQDLSKRIMNGGVSWDKATDELNTMAVNNPAIAHNIHVHQNDDGTTDVIIPAKYRFDKTVQAKYDATVGQEDDNGNIIKPNPNAGRLKIQDASQPIHLDPKNPAQHDQNVGFIVNELDPKSVSSKALTPGGKGHVPNSQGTPPQGKISPDDFNKQWSKIPKGGHLVGPDGVTYTKK